SFTSYRSDKQWQEVATQFGQYRGFEYAMDVDYQHNDGYRVNSGLDRVDFYSTAKFQVTPEDTLFMLTKLQDYHSGDNFQYLFITNARPSLTYDNTQRPLAALGWHHQWSPESHTFLFGGRLENEANQHDVPAPHYLLLGFNPNQILA